MKHLLIYTEHPSSHDARCLRRVLGEDCRVDSVLPIVSEPIVSEDRLRSMLQALAALSDGSTVIVAPSEGETPKMTSEEAITLIKSHEAWRKLLHSFQVDPLDVRLEANEHPRCWVIVALAQPIGIPPGIGFIVDKFSGTVFPRRIVDIISSDGNPI
jgi:hypothetical protein